MSRRTITIELSGSFDLPDNFGENAERILQYGCEVYRRMGEMTESEGMVRLQQKHKKDEERYKLKLEEMHEKLRCQEEELKAERRLERDEICRYMDEGRRQRESEVQLLKDQLEEQRQRIQVNATTQQDGVSQRLTALFTEIQAYNSYVGASAAQKGAVGESFVYNYLCQYFPNYEIQDTSKNASSMSDIYMESSDHKSRILVEVKNVTNLTQVDKTKFEYDIEVCGKSGKINGAILYSLNPANIHSRWFNIVYHSGLPTLYISNVKATPEMIRYGVYVMEELIKRNGFYNESREMEEEHKDFVRTMDGLYKSAESEVKSLERDRRIILSLEGQYKERQQRVTLDLERMREVMDKYKMDMGSTPVARVEEVEEEKEVKQREILEKIRQATPSIVGEITQKVLTGLGIKATDVTKAGGIREIRSLMRVERRIEIREEGDEDDAVGSL